MNTDNLKICFSSSSGGHFEQLMMLEPLMKKYNSYIVTEKLSYEVQAAGLPVHYVLQVNRTDKFFLIKLIVNTFKSLFIVILNRPNVVISTGALASVPLMFWVKVFGGKIVYIESFAKIDNPTLSGKLIYRFADQFYVQWESMKKYFPNAICKGGIY